MGYNILEKCWIAKQGDSVLVLIRRTKTVTDGVLSMSLSFLS